MIVAGVQMDIAWEDPRANFRRVEQLGAVARAEGARLLALPEMFATGFSMRAEMVSHFAEETCEFMAGLARRLGVYVAGGFAEPEEPKPANACALFDPEGRELLRYRKIHPFSLGTENEHYSAGEGVETAEVEGVHVTPLICYDLRFPEVFRPAAAQTHLFLVLANWPEPRREAWAVLLRARAIENQAFVLGVNRTGVGGGETYRGDSVLVGPLGAVLAAPGPAGLVVGEVDPASVREVRERLGFLRDRRPEVYRRLEERPPS
ncbi:nitrilase-related carbon-nitrogen hydrolase [Gemmatimonadota bacterium]